MNIVVQQGSNTQEMHHIKQQSADHTQMVAAQEQTTRAVEGKVRVPEAEKSEKPYLKREKSKEKEGDHPSGDQRQGKRKDKKESDSTGNLLDTVA